MYFENPVPEFLLQEGVAGIQEYDQEKKGNGTIAHNGTRKGYGISDCNKLADAVVKKKPT